MVDEGCFALFCSGTYTLPGGPRRRDRLRSPLERARLAPEDELPEEKEEERKDCDFVQRRRRITSPRSPAWIHPCATKCDPLYTQNGRKKKKKILSDSDDETTVTTTTVTVTTTVTTGGGILKKTKELPEDERLPNSTSQISLCSSDGTDFDETETKPRTRTVNFDLEKNEEYPITSVSDMSWRTRKECYWQPEEYAAMSQSRMWLERAVLRTGGRVRIEGESRRGLGLVCEPETRIARASKIQSTQRAILRMHAEGASSSKLAKFAADTSSWATRNALICAQKDLVAAHEPDATELMRQRVERTFAETYPSHQTAAQVPASPPDDQESPTTPPRSSAPSSRPPRVMTQDTDEEIALSTSSCSSAGSSSSVVVEKMTTRASFTTTTTAPTNGYATTTNGVYYQHRPVDSDDIDPASMHRIDSNTSDTDGLASLIRNDSLNNLSNLQGGRIAAYAAARARFRHLSTSPQAAVSA